jgi:Peptidase family M48
MEFPKPNLIMATRREAKPFIPYLAEAVYENEMNLTIYYNYFFLLKPEDIPKEFQIEEGVESISEEQLNDFITWFKEFLGVKEISVGLEEKEIILCFLKLLAKPEKFEAFKKFILAHELSHLYYKHTLIFSESLEKRNLIRKILSLSIGFFGIAIFRRSLWLSVSLIIGLLLFKITNVALYNLDKLHISRRQEKEADLLAKKHVGAEGGLLLCRQSQQSRLNYIKNNKNLFSLFSRITHYLLTDHQGGIRFALLRTHPTESQRIKYLSSQ